MWEAGQDCEALVVFYYFQSSLLSWVWVDFWMGIGDRDC